MITYSNIQRHDKLSFSEYLALPGKSYSWLKAEKGGVAEDITITDKIRLGTLVDAVLTDPLHVNISDPLYPIARSIAMVINDSFGKVLKHFNRQVSFTADVSCNGFTMHTRGRLDYLMRGVATIDLKVTQEKNIAAMIEYMKYKNQLWHYSRLGETHKLKNYLLIHSVPLKASKLIPIDCSNDYNEWWEERICLHGEIKNIEHVAD